jgi:prepilin-type N-terminal cleavage/methylation domain-containing protein
MRRQARRRGFTLFEVMAAVLVLGMLYAVLANAAMQGLHSEGETRRRLRASLLADAALAEIETQLALGSIPPSGQSESEEDPFLVGVSIQPFDPIALLVPPEPGETAPAPLSGESLLAAGAGGEGRLRRIDVVVRWEEAGDERFVTRTSFAFDTTGLEELFPEEEVAAGDAGNDKSGGIDPEDLRGLSPEQAMQRLRDATGAGSSQ